MLYFVGDHFQLNDRFHPYKENCLLCCCEVLYIHSTTRYSEMYHLENHQACHCKVMDKLQKNG